MWSEQCVVFSMSYVTEPAPDRTMHHKTAPGLLNTAYLMATVDRASAESTDRFNGLFIVTFPASVNK